jgi:large subunit ribosomal protein L25
MINLKANIRSSNSQIKDEILAVAYGPKQAALSISVNYADFIRVYNQAGETGVVTLDLEGKKINTLVHDMTLHPVNNKVSHIDFYVPEAGKKVHANIPLVFTGESEAVKAGNILIKVIDRKSVV